MIHQTSPYGTARNCGRTIPVANAGFECGGTNRTELARLHPLKDLGMVAGDAASQIVGVVAVGLPVGNLDNVKVRLFRFR